MIIADTQTAREFAAKSHEARRRNKALRELDDTPSLSPPLQPANALQERAKELDALLARLKEQLRSTTDALDAMRLAQAIDRLEQSWARYAGIPTPPKGKANSRRQTSSPPEPLD